MSDFVIDIDQMSKAKFGGSWGFEWIPPFHRNRFSVSPPSNSLIKELKHKGLEKLFCFADSYIMITNSINVIVLVNRKTNFDASVATFAFLCSVTGCSPFLKILKRFVFGASFVISNNSKRKNKGREEEHFTFNFYPEKK